MTVEGGHMPCWADGLAGPRVATPCRLAPCVCVCGGRVGRTPSVGGLLSLPTGRGGASSSGSRSPVPSGHRFRLRDRASVVLGAGAERGAGLGELGRLRGGSRRQHRETNGARGERRWRGVPFEGGLAARCPGPGPSAATEATADAPPHRSQRQRGGPWQPVPDKTRGARRRAPWGPKLLCWTAAKEDEPCPARRDRTS